MPRRLIFVTAAAAAAAGALGAQVAMRHADSLQEINLQNLIGLKQPNRITGVASVIDGDTIELHGQRIRFNGIDAPESKQYCDDAKGFEYPCGRRSAEALDSFLAASRPVQCRFVTWDRYHRFVGDCRRADGASAAAWMVEHGQALDWPRYSQGAFAAEQAKAEAAKVGLWVGNFQAPWDWRASHPDGAALTTHLARHRQPQAGRAERLFMRAAAVLLADRFVRRSPMVSAQLPLGPEAGSGRRRGRVRDAVLVAV